MIGIPFKDRKYYTNHILILLFTSTKQIPWLSVRKRTIPTERRPPVGESSANFPDRGVSRGRRGGTPTVDILSFPDRSLYFYFKAVPQLSSCDWVDPVPDLLPVRKSGSVDNRTRDLRVCRQEFWLLEHRGGPPRFQQFLSNYGY
jgi:hypothetical protein